MINEIEIRKAIIDEAITWIRTPWHHEARVKGAGVDCGMFLLEIYEKVGLIPHIQPDHYNMDFMMHHSEEWFMETILKYADEITEEPFLPGDAMLFRQGRIYSHGAIILDWPRIIHASASDKCVTYGDVNMYPLAGKKRKIFRCKVFK